MHHPIGRLPSRRLCAAASSNVVRWLLESRTETINALLFLKLCFSGTKNGVKKVKQAAATLVKASLPNRLVGLKHLKSSKSAQR